MTSISRTKFTPSAAAAQLDVGNALDNAFTITITNHRTNQTKNIPVYNQQKFNDVSRKVDQLTGVCSYCGAMNDHIKRDCPKQKRDRSVADRHGLCRVCLKPGHFERDCPDRPSDMPTTSPQAYVRGPVGRSDKCRW